MKYLFQIIALLMLSSCTPEAQPIPYGKCECSNCKMIVVDNHFGSEIINKKGKAYFFDSIECMVNFSKAKKMNPDEIAMELVTDFLNPGNLLAKEKAFFVVSKNLKSPMGEGIAAFSSLKDAGEAINKYQGKIVQWEELNQMMH